ncbi:MAG: hypothetical protein HZB62_12965 [Nitrospirae bacterium]|nr:hypothetical protein [Nitrospirota bacterium]
MSENGKYILILRATEDKRLQYISARRLALLWPHVPFAQWKARVESGETMILMRSDSSSDLARFKRELDEISAPVEIVEQKSIGGASVY